jgi:hypothetical protein
MVKINAYKRPGYRVKIEQTKVQRDWMDATLDRHAYKCFPVSLANSIGFSISFLDDIEFIWDGVSDSSPKHVTVLKGNDFCTTSRANGTINFISNIKFKTDKNMSMLSIVPPNHFIDGATPFTSIISTSFFEDMLPISWKITRPNTKILIPAGTPVATVIPISLKQISDIELDIYDLKHGLDYELYQQKKADAWHKITSFGGFTNFYRDAVDYEGNKIGEHEVKSLVLNVNDYTTEKDK